MKLPYPLIVIIILIAFPQILPADSHPVRNIILKGNESFSNRQIRALMQTQLGENYDEELLQQDFDRIVDFYSERGFRFARIDAERLFIKKFSDGVYLRIYIDEGKIGKITVEGNSHTQSHVIIRELLFQVGSTYTREDELESERILRRKPYLGSAEIHATRDPETMLVWMQVEVTDLWTFIPAFDLSSFNKDNADVFVSLSDTNLFGSGDSARLRYQLIREEGEKPRTLVKSQYTAAHLFDSHWEFDGDYTQKREGNSWEVSLRRPLYSLQTRWGADFTRSESVDEIRWYEHGKKTDTFERTMQTQSGRVTRVFGDRHQQAQVSLWGVSQNANFKRIDEKKLAPSNANFRNKDIQMIGVSLGRRRTDFIRTRFLNQMGRVEDIGVGYGYGASIGYASPVYGSERSEANLSLSFTVSQAYQDELFVNANTELTTHIVERQLEDSVFSANIKGVRKNLFHQTLAAQLSTVVGFGLNGESQVILGGLNGLRGYETRQFSGEKMIVLNVESRAVFWEHSLIVVGGVLFADIGYVWNGEAFDLRDAKRSIGFGLRFSIPKLTESRVYRIDFAYPLDTAGELSFKPVITSAIGHAF